MKTITLFLVASLAITGCSGNVSDGGDGQDPNENAASPQSGATAEGDSTGRERSAARDFMSDTLPGPTGAPTGAASSSGSGSQGPATPHVHTLQ